MSIEQSKEALLEQLEALKKELDMVASKMLDAYLADADESIKKIFTEFKK